MKERSVFVKRFVFEQIESRRLRLVVLLHRGDLTLEADAIGLPVDALRAAAGFAMAPIAIPMAATDSGLQLGSELGVLAVARLGFAPPFLAA